MAYGDRGFVAHDCWDWPARDDALSFALLRKEERKRATKKDRAGVAAGNVDGSHPHVILPPLGWSRDTQL